MTNSAAAPVPTYSPQPAYPIDSVDHVLKLLVLLQADSTLRVAQVAKTLNVANSTAHRLLAMLLYRGFVIKDEGTPTYRAGPMLVNIGLAALTNLDIRRRARPYLLQLSERSTETVTLMILEGPSVRFVDAVESPNLVRVGSRTGGVMPAYATSGGKAMLAALAPEILGQLFPEEQLAPVTRATISTRAELLDQLRTVRRNGYAINQSESEDGLVAVGAAICNGREYPLAALNIAAPAARVTPERLLQLADMLRAVIDELTAKLYD